MAVASALFAAAIVYLALIRLLVCSSLAVAAAINHAD